jgi:hypothetical protein
VKKFLAFYGTRSFTTASISTRYHHCTLYVATYCLSNYACVAHSLHVFQLKLCTHLSAARCLLNLPSSHFPFLEIVFIDLSVRFDLVAFFSIYVIFSRYPCFIRKQRLWFMVSSFRFTRMSPCICPPSPLIKLFVNIGHLTLLQLYPFLFPSSVIPTWRPYEKSVLEAKAAPYTA